jgi:gas vesicle protein
MDTLKKAKIFITSFTIGGLIGGLSGLLLAPKSGTETRELLRDKGMEFRDKVVENVDTTRQQAEQKFESIAQQTKDKANKLKNVGQRMVSEQKDSVNKGVEDAQKIVNEGKWE